ncbi:Modification methylase HgiDII [uncultured Spirochaetota bacterium]|nr:Modification methylase HgiDII [uncultured Spirochaetota bacterium]
MKDTAKNNPICAIDLFCGAGGLTYGLRNAGIKVNAGIDINKNVKYAYEYNNFGTAFYDWDVSKKNYQSVQKLFEAKSIKLLAGCAPCQPFSRLTNGIVKHEAWGLLDNFGRFISRIIPEFVTMENVPELATRGSEVFNRFIKILKKNKYYYDWKIVNCEEYGIPQARRRLVLLASRLGPIEIPEGKFKNYKEQNTVRTAISFLPAICSGEQAENDRLHTASRLSPMNIKRVQAIRHDGGTRKDWPADLLLECYRKESGTSYSSNYGRMYWDKPSPTITTLCTGLGNGKFGHPEQDRAISLREAALLQSFPKEYEFWPTNERLNKTAIAKMIGNAVPPLLAKVLGDEIVKNKEKYLNKEQ